MHPHIIVIGTSAGGVQALKRLFGALPRDLDASLFVVLHTAPESPGVLASIIQRAGVLPAVAVRSSERIEKGRVYVASPDHHLVIEPGIARATRGPRENRARPAIDPLFRSAAQVYGPRVIGVILTGALDDGTAGPWTVKSLGGTAVVQDPAEADHPSMPRSALDHVAVDHCVPLDAIAPLLARLTRGTQPPKAAVETPKEVAIEVEIAKAANPLEAGVLELGEPSRIACPDCHGVLMRVNEATQFRFRCHTGHAYSPQALMAAIGDSIEEGLWTTIRSMQESALLMRELADHAAEHHDAAAVERMRAAACAAERRAERLRHAAVAEASEPLSTDRAS